MRTVLAFLRFLRDGMRYPWTHVVIGLGLLPLILVVLGAAIYAAAGALFAFWFCLGLPFMVAFWIGGRVGLGIALALALVALMLWPFWQAFRAQQKRDALFASMRGGPL